MYLPPLSGRSPPLAAPRQHRLLKVRLPAGSGPDPRCYRTRHPRYLSDSFGGDLHAPAGRQLVLTNYGLPPGYPRSGNELIVEGTREGLDAVRARGTRLGRPPAMTPEQIRHARDLLTVCQCAAPSGAWSVA